MKDGFLDSIPSLEKFEARFDFVRNSTLRGNAAIYLRYIVFLLALCEDQEIDALRYSLYKDIIIHTASIVECILEYAVKECIVSGKAEENAFGFSWHYSEVSPINHDCTEFEHAKFCLAKKIKIPKSSSRDLDFADINNAAKRTGILDGGLYSKADSLRKQRNLIHLSSLEKSTNDYFKKKDTQAAFNGAHDIIVKVEDTMKQITSS